MRTEWILPLAGVGCMLLTLLFFCGCWVGMRRRRLKPAPGLGEWINGLGFGLLPAMTVAKVFGQYTLSGSRGTELMAPLKPVPWITEDGRFFPGRIDMLLFLAAFTGICLWLIFRKSEFPTNGDMAGVSLTLWAGIRTATESLRAVSQMDVGEWRIVYLAALGVTVLWLVLWTGRRRRIKNTGQTAIYWLVTILTTTGVWILVSGTLSTGSEIGDLAAITGCCIVRTAALLAAGGDSRRG